MCQDEIQQKLHRVASRLVKTSTHLAHIAKPGHLLAMSDLNFFDFVCMLSLEEQGRLQILSVEALPRQSMRSLTNVSIITCLQLSKVVRCLRFFETEQLLVLQDELLL